MDPEQQPTYQLQPTKPSRWQSLKQVLSTLLLLAAAPIIALTLTVFVFQSYEVDGPSMQPTLHDNDRLIVLKLNRSWAKLTNHAYIPERGAIVIFNKQDLGIEENLNGKQLIKRVIGVPGDRVVVNNGKLKVFNKANPGGFDPDTRFGLDITSTPGNDQDITVSKGEVYVLGDNRPNSLDSRTFGTVSAEDIIGTLSLRIFPLSSAQKF